MYNLLFFIGFLSTLNFSIEGHYERRNQFCGGLYGEDIKWSLKVNNNKTFYLETTKSKNEYLSKPKHTFITGTWEVSADTIRLFQWAKKDEALIFFSKSNRLVFQNMNLKLSNQDFLFLDYMEKIER